MEYIKLGDLCVESRGMINASAEDIIDYVDISSIDNTAKKIAGYESIRFCDAPSRARKLAKKNDIIISMVRPNLNAVAICDIEVPHQLVVSTGFCVLTAKPEVSHEYLFHFCRSKQFIDILVRQATGASYPAVNDKIIREVILPSHSAQEQFEIASRLNSVQRMIIDRSSQIRALDQLIKARFVEMFGDITINDKGWDIQPLGELCTIVRGGSPRPIEAFLGGDVPWIKIGDATEGENIYLNSTKEYIIQEGVKRSRLVKSGSLIFANCGVSLGFARIITFDGCIHDGWLAMEDIDVRLNKVFLLLSLNQMTEHFRDIAPAGTQPNLNTAIMKAYLQIIPPLSLQQEFISFVDHVNKSKAAVQKALDKTQLLFDSLMQEYFG